MRSRPAATLERMRAYSRVRRLVAEGTPPSAAVLTAKLREDGLTMPSRETVRRWALEMVSPSSSAHVFEPEPSEELSFFVGAWFGDGWADESDGSKRLAMKVRSYDFAKEFADCAAKILGKKDSYWVRRINGKRGRWYFVKVTSILLYDFVNQTFEKLIPFLSENPRGFLRGIFTAEGNPSISLSTKRSLRLDVGICIANTDLTLLEYCRDALAQLGLRPSQLKINRLAGEVTNLARAGKTEYQFHLSRLSDVAEFADSIGFADGAKQSKLEDAIGLIRSKSRRDAALEWSSRYTKVNGKWTLGKIHASAAS